MTEVWHVTVPVDDQWHRLSVGPVVHVASRVPSEVELWFENEPMSTRKFKVIGTGHRIPDKSQHVGTALTASGRLVWHVYEDLGFST